MTDYPKRLIEVELPIKRISAHARREKNIRHGHISTLHIWWARRPLAACRAVICASLWLDPADKLCPNTFRKIAREQMTKWAKNHLDLLSEDSWSRFVDISKDGQKLDDLVELRAALLDFIADFANWDNSTAPEYLETSRVLTRAAHEALGGEPGSRPLVVDPFAGGGSIPLEALRVGAEAFASDLNPVAVLLNKVVLEYIPEYGQKLAYEVRKWGEWVKEKAEKKLVEFYPKGPDGATPIAYIWARTIICEGPGCGYEVPVVRSLWLERSSRSKTAIELTVSTNSPSIEVHVIQVVDSRNVGSATSQRSSVTCPRCGYTTPRKDVEKQAKTKGLGCRLLAVATQSDYGRKYRAPSDTDFAAIASAESVLQSSKQRTMVPSEELPYLRSIFNVHVYGLREWGMLFSTRQQLYLTTLYGIVRDVDLDSCDLDDVGKTALRTLLAFIADKSAMVCCNIARWRGDKGRLEGAFAMQAMPMVWDWAELNPFNDYMMPFKGFVNAVAEVVETVSHSTTVAGSSSSNSATDVPLPDDSATLLFTDPPYYDAIPYANLSDFFYVWLKRALGRYYPELFGADETPKDMEIVQLAERNPKYAHKTRAFFENEMRKAMADARRVNSPNGIGCIVFAHKTTSGWESLVNAIIEAGWIVTASWPIDTEMTTRLKAIGTASLASSVHLVCRPRENPDGTIRTDDIGDWRDVLAELPKRIHEWMPRLTKEGVVGADAIFACLGPALEIYSRYSSVEKASGEKVELKEYLEEVWAAVSREALNMIFQGADASGFEEDARLTAMWLWTLRTTGNAGEAGAIDSGTTKSLTGYSLEYDAARKIAQGLGAHLENLSHLVEIKGKTATLLSVASRTRYLFGKDATEVPKGTRKRKLRQRTLFDLEDDIRQMEEESGERRGDIRGKAGSTVLDQLHQSMILFATGRSVAMKRFLVDEGVGRNPLFWRLAQALSALYPAGADEKRWVDGVLARKKGLGL